MDNQIEIRSTQGRTAQITIDGQKIRNVSKMQLEINPYEVPKILLELVVSDGILVDLMDSKVLPQWFQLVASDPDALQVLKEMVDAKVGE